MVDWTAGLTSALSLLVDGRVLLISPCFHFAALSVLCREASMCLVMAGHLCDNSVACICACLWILVLVWGYCGCVRNYCVFFTVCTLICLSAITLSSVTSGLFAAEVVPWFLDSDVRSHDDGVSVHDKVDSSWCLALLSGLVFRLSLAPDLNICSRTTTP